MFRLFTGSIRNKLLLATGLGTVIVLASASFGMWQAWVAIQGYRALVGKDMTYAREIQSLEVAFLQEVGQWNKMLLEATSPDSVHSYWSNYKDLQAKVEKGAGKLEGSVEQPAVRKLLGKFISSEKDMSAGFKVALDASLSSSGFDPKSAHEMVMGQSTTVARILDKAAADLQKVAVGKSRVDSARAHRGFLISLSVMAVAVIVAFVFFLWLLQRSILRPARRLVADLDRLAGGDFATPVQRSTNDEFGMVAASAQHIQGRLGQVISELRKATEQLSQAAAELAATSEQAGTGVSRQKSEINDVAAAMNQMTTTVQEVARNAAEAATAAQNADHESRDGQGIVADTVSAIGFLAQDIETAAEVIQRLDKSSADIGEVLDVIRGIAEQTNLLALNAAIEAARAGEQGRGFAVVADEVRALALRTQQSTEQIHDMIERLQGGTAETVQVMDKSRSRTQEAVGKAEKAGSALESITQAVATISSMNTQIAGAAEEQNAVAEEMNRNIVNISQVAEESTEGAARAARSSEELSRLAGQLKVLVQQFQV